MTGPTEIGPMSAVREFVDGFNASDIDRFQATCEDETSIIDDIPPHAWTGSGAVRRWYLDMVGLALKYGMSDWSVSLREPADVTVSERSAYVVASIDVRWLQDGEPIERGGFMTLALREAERWRISAFAWTWN